MYSPSIVLVKFIKNLSFAPLQLCPGVRVHYKSVNVWDWKTSGRSGLLFFCNLQPRQCHAQLSINHMHEYKMAKRKLLLLGP